MIPDRAVDPWTGFVYFLSAFFSLSLERLKVLDSVDMAQQRFLSMFPRTEWAVVPTFPRREPPLIANPKEPVGLEVMLNVYVILAHGVDRHWRNLLRYLRTWSLGETWVSFCTAGQHRACSPARLALSDSITTGGRNETLRRQPQASTPTCQPIICGKQQRTGHKYGQPSTGLSSEQSESQVNKLAPGNNLPNRRNP